MTEIEQKALALVDAKLYGMGVLKNGKHVPIEDVYLDPRDALIETQAREIERLREALEEFVASTGVSDDPDVLLVDALVYENAMRVLGL